MPDDYDYSQPVSRSPLRNISVPFVTMLLITFSAVFTAAYWVAPHNDTVNPLSNLVSAILPTSLQIWDGHYFGLFTSFFIHLDIMHLLFNMLWLWKLGSTLERTIPTWQYILFIVLATVVSSCCELFISGQTGAGASGTGYALMGLLWGGGGFHEAWRQVATRDNMRLFLIWGVVCIFLTVSHTMNVGNGAHFGGLLFGLAVGYLFYAPRRRPIWIPALVFLVGVCIASLAWLPWTPDWNEYKGLQAARKHRYAEAVAYDEHSLKRGGANLHLLQHLAYCWSEIAKDDRAHNRNEAAAAASAQAEAYMAIVKEATSPSATSEDSSDSTDQGDQADPKAQQSPQPQPPNHKKGP